MPSVFCPSMGNGQRNRKDRGSDVGGFCVGKSSSRASVFPNFPWNNRRIRDDGGFPAFASSVPR